MNYLTIALGVQKAFSPRLTSRCFEANRVCGILPLLVSLLASSPAVAIDGTSDADHSASGAQLDEVVVTARKRSEDLQNVPASVLVVGQAAIESLNAKSLEDLNGATPNANIGVDGTITIRGISSNARNAGFEAGAAVYIDGVYQGRPPGNDLNLSDVSQVEVLRGPQGTLFGKNTTAGAFNVVTVEPTDTLQGKVDLQFGSRDDEEASGYIAGPLIDSLLGLKLSAYRRKQDGYQDNLYNGDRYGNVDNEGGRFELRLTPGTWDIALRGDFSGDDGVPDVPKAVYGFAAATASGFDQINQNVGARLEVHTGGVSLTGIDTLPGDYTLTTISAWRKLDEILDADDDFSPLNGVYHDWLDRARQVSEEIRFASPSSEQLTYLAGLYYFGQVLNSYRPVTLSTGFPVQGQLNDIVQTDTTSLAGFGNADYHFTDRFTLDVGLRYTWEHKKLFFVQDPLLALGYPAFDFDDKLTETDFAPTGSLSYQFSPAITGYGRISRGFKSGGWNPDITSTPNIAFGPENVTNYEAGLRTRLLDDRLSINVTVFYMDYKNLQVSEFLGTYVGQAIRNAAAAKVKGTEWELQAKPLPWLDVSSGADYNAATYTKFDSGTGVNYSGEQLQNAPRFSGYLSSDAHIPAGAVGTFVIHGDFRYQSRVYFDDARTISPVGPFAQGGYGLLNARFGLDLPNNIGIYLFGQNLTDRRYLYDRLNDALGLGLVVDQYSPPRMFGIRLDYRF
jgi:iron complex outermembrane recepter protein